MVHVDAFPHNIIFFTTKSIVMRYFWKESIKELEAYWYCAVGQICNYSLIPSFWLWLVECCLIGLTQHPLLPHCSHLLLRSYQSEPLCLQDSQPNHQPILHVVMDAFTVDMGIGTNEHEQWHPNGCQPTAHTDGCPQTEVPQFKVITVWVVCLKTIQHGSF